MKPYSSASTSHHRLQSHAVDSSGLVVAAASCEHPIYTAPAVVRTGAARLAALPPRSACARRWRRSGSAAAMYAPWVLTGQMHGWRCLTQRPGTAPGHPMERPAYRRGMPGNHGLARLRPHDGLTGNKALTGFTAPKILWVRKHEPEVYSPRRAHFAAQRLRALLPDRRNTLWTRQMAQAPILFDLKKRTGRAKYWRRCKFQPPAAAHLRRAGSGRGDQRERGGTDRAGAPARRWLAAGATRQPRRSAWAR